MSDETETYSNKERKRIERDGQGSLVRDRQRQNRRQAGKTRNRPIKRQSEMQTDTGREG